MNRDGWFPGFVDGEGYIGIAKRKSVYSAHLRVGNTHRGALELFQETFGGHIRVIHHKENQRIVYSWKLSRRDDLERTLEAWLPYLVVKQEQAKLALQLIKYKKAYPRPWGNGTSKGRPYPMEMRARLEELHRRIKALNKVGGHANWEGSNEV